MEEIVNNRDQLQQTIAEHREKPNTHPLIKQINQWEQQSIEKIRETADNRRKELLTVIDRHTKRVSDDLIQVTEEVNTARNENDYVETDLQAWINQLMKLNEDLNASKAITFGKYENETSLISNIFINSSPSECFESKLGDIQIMEYGRLAIHDIGPTTAAVLCRGTYASGQHRIRFEFDQTGGHPIFIGIISAGTPLECILHDQNLNKTTKTRRNTILPYEWNYQNTNNASFYLNTNNYLIEPNQTFEFVIDCNQKLICLTSDRPLTAAAISQDTSRCPLPWQCFASFSCPGARLRLC